MNIYKHICVEELLYYCYLISLQPHTADKNAKESRNGAYNVLT